MTTNPDLALFHADGRARAEFLETFTNKPTGTALTGILYMLDDADAPTKATKCRGVLTVEPAGLWFVPETARH